MADDMHAGDMLAGVHVLEYHPWPAGFSEVNDVPHWRCSCGGWRVSAISISGLPRWTTATEHHRKHLLAVKQAVLEEKDHLVPPSASTSDAASLWPDH